MSNSVRVKSRTGTYHLMVRGVNKQRIFEEEEDYEKFLEYVKHYRKQEAFELYAYCLMSNHVHLLAKEKEKTISQSMQSIQSRYAKWYNDKYERVGHLFQSRFRSECVETAGSLLRVVRYIHRNPVKAGMCNRVSEYKYSSFLSYINGKNDIDSEAVFRSKDMLSFVEYNDIDSEDEFLDLPEKIKRKYTDDKVVNMIEQMTCCKNITEFQKLDEEQKRTCLILLSDKGISFRQLNRLTGMSRKKIQQCCS